MDDDLLFQCVHCDFAVEDLLQLDIHSALQHTLLQYKLIRPKSAKAAPRPMVPAPANRFQCKWCNKFCGYNSALKKHQRVHTGEKPFACEQCGARFAQQGNLAQHAERHNSRFLFVCSVCKWRFPSLRSRRNHVNQAHPVKKDNVAMKPRPTRYEHKNNGRAAKMIPTEQKMARCPHCSKEFASCRDLGRHAWRHGNALPHVCPRCGCGYGTQNGLNVHITKFCNFKA